jgi:hypothetical protein
MLNEQPLLWALATRSISFCTHAFSFLTHPYSHLSIMSKSSLTHPFASPHLDDSTCAAFNLLSTLEYHSLLFSFLAFCITHPTGVSDWRDGGFVDFACSLTYHYIEGRFILLILFFLIPSAHHHVSCM